MDKIEGFTETLFNTQPELILQSSFHYPFNSTGKTVLCELCFVQRSSYETTLEGTEDSEAEKTVN